MKSLSVVIGLAAVAAGLLLGPTHVLAESAEKGKEAFLLHGCWQCHGYQAQGGIAGVKLAPNPIPFETLSNFVRTTNRAMPPFGKEILSDEDMADIYAYLQSIPKDPDPDSIPLLNP